MKTVSLLLATMLLFGLLAGCNTNTQVPKEPDPTTVTTTSSTTSSSTTTTVQTEPSQTTTTTKPEDTEPVYEEAERNIRELLTAWVEKDVETVARHTNNQEVAQFLLDSVVLDAYAVQHISDGENGESSYTVQMRVSQSGYEAIPVGESEWIASYGYRFAGVALCPASKDLESYYRVTPEKDWSPADFCYSLSMNLEIYETVEDFSRFSKERLVERDDYLVTAFLACFRGKGASVERDIVPSAELNAFLKKTFNMDAVDFSTGEHYDAELDGVRIPARGGDFLFPHLISETEKNGVYTVELCYCADYLWLVDGVIMRYKVQDLGDGEYRLLSCEKVSDRGFGVAKFNI